MAANNTAAQAPLPSQQQTLPTTQTQTAEPAANPLPEQPFPEATNARAIEPAVKALDDGTVSLINEAKQLAAMFEWAQRKHFLITPPTAVRNIPEGFEIAFTKIFVQPAETYPQPGSDNVSLSKAALERIGLAAGVRWDIEHSGRVDDGSDPHYCCWRAVGAIPQFDGTYLPVDKTRQLDLRDGSAMMRKIVKEGKTEQSGWKSLLQQRAFILEHTESKAQLRALRSLSIRSNYHPSELGSKAFIVAKLMFTGHSEDPELRRQFAMMRASKALGLFGDTFPNDPRAHAANSALSPTARSVVQVPATRRQPPPPVQDLDDEDDDEQPPMAAGPDAAPMREPPPKPQEETIPGAKKGEPRIPVSEAKDEDLVKWRGRIESDLKEGKSKFEGKDRKLLKAIDEELEKRVAAIAAAKGMTGPTGPTGPAGATGGKDAPGGPY